MFQHAFSFGKQPRLRWWEPASMYPLKYIHVTGGFATPINGHTTIRGPQLVERRTKALYASFSKQAGGKGEAKLAYRGAKVTVCLHLRAIRRGWGGDIPGVYLKPCVPYVAVKREHY
uniref:Uncharacterized protein n=1 Tax=Strongyloides papillosus TaxID=174720 RepID=A0A0N5B3Y6_STREA